VEPPTAAGAGTGSSGDLQVAGVMVGTVPYRPVERRGTACRGTGT
jgi:hypothetical protein